MNIDNCFRFVMRVTRNSARNNAEAKKTASKRYKECAKSKELKRKKNKRDNQKKVLGFCYFCRDFR